VLCWRPRPPVEAKGPWFGAGGSVTRARYVPPAPRGPSTVECRVHLGQSLAAAGGTISLRASAVPMEACQASLCLRFPVDTATAGRKLIYSASPRAPTGGEVRLPGSTAGSTASGRRGPSMHRPQCLAGAAH